MFKLRTDLLSTAAVLALSGGAYAADMGVPIKAPPAAPIPYTNWTGGYVGGYLGVARLDSSCTAIAPSNGYGSCVGAGGVDSAVNQATGLTAGGKIGYDWQSRYFVYGVLADWSWTGLKRNTAGAGQSIGFFQSKVDWLASFRGRMGLAVDDTMMYLTGGLALGGVKDNAGMAAGYIYSDTANKTQAGWVAGVGVEHKLNQNLSVVGEFLYYDLGTVKSNTAISSPSVGTYTSQFTNAVMTATLGLNWRF